MAGSYTCDLEVALGRGHICNAKRSAALDNKNIVIAMVLGILAGWLASWIVGGYGLVQYLISGVLGSFVGSFCIE